MRPPSLGSVHSKGSPQHADHRFRPRRSHLHSKVYDDTHHHSSIFDHCERWPWTSLASASSAAWQFPPQQKDFAFSERKKKGFLKVKCSLLWREYLGKKGTLQPRPRRASRRPRPQTPRAWGKTQHVYEALIRIERARQKLWEPKSLL